MSNQELLDIYDKNRNKTGKTIVRHVDKTKDGEYIIGVQAIILNKNKEILISKRSATMRVLPSKWECNGGALNSDEDSLDGLIREINEELGITLDKSKAIYVGTAMQPHVFKDIYVFSDDIKTEEIHFKDGEVDDVKYVSIDTFMEMFDNDEIVYNVNFNREDYKKCLVLLEKKNL